MAYETTSNPLDAVFGLLNRKLELDAEQKRQEASLDTFGGDARYGVDEYGRAYLRGAPSVAQPLLGLGNVPPLVVIGVGILAVTLVAYALKR